MAGKKRAVSLDQRLASIRTTTPEEDLDAPAADLEVTETPANLDVPESIASFASFESAQERVPDRTTTSDPSDLIATGEGDTFLPGSAAAANRVDVGVAVQEAVSQLWPELEKAEKPVAIETSPEESPKLSKLLGRGWMSRRGSHENHEPETAPDAQTEGATDDETTVEVVTENPAETNSENTVDVDDDASELENIIAEIAEINEAVAPTPAPWKPIRGRIPKPKPKKSEPQPVVRRIVEAVPEPVVDEVAHEQVAEEPVVDEVAHEQVAEEPVVEPEPPAIASGPELVVEASEQAELDTLVAEAEAQLLAVDEAVETFSEDSEPEELEDLGPWARPVRKERFGRIGTTLTERGLITIEQLDEALEIQRTSGKRVGDILVDLGALSAFELARVLADHMGVPFTDLRSKPPDPIIAALIPEDVARRYDALAISRWNEQLVVAMANPTDLFALDDLQMVTRQPIIAAMAVKEDLRAALDRVYRVSLVETVDAAKVDYNLEAEAAALAIDEADEGPIVGLVNALMGQAITDHASDLHIEPCSTHVAIRMRIDGVLHDSSTVPIELLRPVVSRVKILAGLDIANNRLAQDGRFSLTIDGRSVDVRVVTMPTSAGEAVILRLLDPIRDALGISSLGLSPAELARFIPAFTASQGAVFIAGPTGSGKTSTIYAVLTEVNTRTKSIVSVENPVEFKLDGIKQMQINARVGLTFPNALPTVLRSDPDVVFIGEVRDTDTARIAADAAITGHLVLSTLHATRAASAPMRLVEMGVEPYLVASALTLVASQRLTRKLCELCAEPADDATIDQLRGLGADDSQLHGATVRTAVGCPACRGTGYVGRFPIFEIMPVTEGISRLILERASRAQIEDLAVEEGMDTLLRAAIKRIVRGELSVDEMLRVIS